MPKPNYDLSDARMHSVTRVTSLLETYRPNKAHFTAYQLVADNLGWSIYDRVLSIEYIHKVDYQPDVTFKAMICPNIDQCFLPPKMIKEIVDWFTKEIVIGGKHTTYAHHLKSTKA